MEGAVIGSPVSPILDNIYMEYLVDRALRTAQNPPSLWKRYTDDTFVIHYKEQREQFLQHFNSIDNAIQLTVEDTMENGSIAFLDIVTPEHKGMLSTSVYRTPTNTEQYQH